MAITPIATSLIGRGILSGVQTIAGLSKKAERPEMGVPQGVQEATDMARQLASTTYRPGKSQEMSEIERGSATATSRLQRSTTNPAELIQGVGAVQAQENRAKNRSQILDERFRDKQRRNLMRQLGIEGQWQDRVFQYNQAAPYQEAKGERSALIGAGLSNAITTLGDVASYDIMKDVYGLGNQTEGGSNQNQPAANPMFHKQIKNDAKKFPSRKQYGNPFTPQYLG